MFKEPLRTLDGRSLGKVAGRLCTERDPTVGAFGGALEHAAFFVTNHRNKVATMSFHIWTYGPYMFTTHNLSYTHGLNYMALL
jgi:hypothetical protein